MTTIKNTSQEIVELRINLIGHLPEIWRIFRVPSAISLSSLHNVIQIVMGWENCHLHTFFTQHQRFMDFGSSETGFDDALDSRSVALSHLLKAPGDKLGYEYDFGDGWAHNIVAVSFSQGTSAVAECLDGKGQCPPEDIGGIPGFHNFLDAMEDPEHEEHEWFLSEFGERFDINDFNIKNVNKKLKTHKISTRLLKAKKTAR